jgi:hypothetical protein
VKSIVLSKIGGPVITPTEQIAPVLYPELSFASDKQRSIPMAKLFCSTICISVA